METFYKIKEMIHYADGGIMSKEFIKTSGFSITLFSMASGTEISEHTTTKHGFAYIIEGRGVFAIGGERVEMVPGVMITIGENVIHSVKAEDNTSFLLYLSN